MAPLSIGAWFLAYAVTSPSNHSDVGFMFYYPIYFRTSYQSLFSLGSWLWVYTLLWVGKRIANQKFNHYYYELIVGSSMNAYVFHYLFIVLASTLLVRPLQLDYIPALVTNWCVAIAGI